MRTGVKIALGLGALGATALLLTVGGEPPEREETPGEPMGRFIEHPLYLGRRGDPELEALLVELNDYLASEGINTEWLSAEEVTLLHKKKWAGMHAIPPREYWPRLARTGREVFMPLRIAMDMPIRIANGYRFPEYNKAVTATKDDPEGSTGSRHQDASGLDMEVKGIENKKRFALLAARLYLDEGQKKRLGLGIYGTDTFPSRVHADTGGHRKWANTAHWLKEAARVS